MRKYIDLKKMENGTNFRSQYKFLVKITSDKSSNFKLDHSCKHAKSTLSSNAYWLRLIPAHKENRGEEGQCQVPARGDLDL